MRKKSEPKISSIKFYKHRFKKGLQTYFLSDVDPLEAYAKLKTQQNLANKKLGGFALLFTVTAIALISSMHTGSLNVKTAFASFSIPSVYLLFVSSLMWANFCLAFISACQLVTFSDAFKRYFGRYKNDYEMLVFLQGVEIDDFIAPPTFDTYLAPSRFGYITRVLLFSAIIIAFAIPIVVSLVSIFDVALKIFNMNQAAPLSNSLVVASGVITVCSTIFMITAFVPFRTKRQTSLIRWSVLYNIHEKAYRKSHPRSSDWIDEKEASEDI